MTSAPSPPAPGVREKPLEANPTRQRPAPFLSRVWPRLTGTAAILSGLLAGFCLLLPQQAGVDSGPALVTVAWAWHDLPSGIYYDRQFDWPTGEAVWIDLPVWLIQAAAIGLVAIAARLHWTTTQRPPET